MKTYTKEIIKGYVECMIWTMPEEENIFNDYGSYDFEDLSYSAIRKAVRDCREFMARTDDDILSVDMHLERIGHDFWLTRNGHGAGFWDGDYEEPYAANLTEVSHEMGGCEAYVGDDGKVYLM